MGKAKAGPSRYYFAEWGAKVGKRQRDVVKATGLNKGFISLLWSGNKEPSGETLAAIAKTFGVPSWALLAAPDSFPARAFAAVTKLSPKEQETAVEMLEGLAQKRKPG